MISDSTQSHSDETSHVAAHTVEETQHGNYFSRGQYYFLPEKGEGSTTKDVAGFTGCNAQVNTSRALITGGTACSSNFHLTRS